MKILFINLFLLLSLMSFSQNLGEKLNDNDKKTFELKIKEKSKELKSLECNFTQEKKTILISETNKSIGSLKYKDNSKLRWEYISPDVFSLIINNNVVAMYNDKNEKIQSDKMEKYLASFIINSINGSFITATKDFQSEYYLRDDVVNVKLLPVSKQFKQIFKYLIIELDKINFVANSVVMREKSDDETIIIFTDKKINGTISDSFFNIK